MKMDSVTVQMTTEKLRAVRRYMEKRDLDLEHELTEALHKLYDKYVPQGVRAYIDEGIVEADSGKASKGIKATPKDKA